MEKDIDRIQKNDETDIVIRVDDFGGNIGVTIREFVKSDRYTGFTKSGTRIPADKFKQFKEAINSIDESDLEAPTEAPESKSDEQKQEKLEGSEESQEESSSEEETKEETPEEKAM